MRKRNFILLITILLPLTSMAQNTGWQVVDEAPKAAVKVEKEPKTKVKQEILDAPYMQGKVPEVDGMVTFTREFKAPGQTAQELYELTYALVSGMAKESKQIDSRITLKNDGEHSFAARFKEWMVFSEHLLAVDRTEFHYSMVVLCEDGHLTVGINHLSYIYQQGKVYKDETWKTISPGEGMVVKAEEWITDREAINKKGTKLLRFTRKFRIGTIDRMNDIFEQFEEALNRNK